MLYRIIKRDKRLVDLSAHTGMKTWGGQVKQIQDPSLAFYSSLLTH